MSFRFSLRLAFLLLVSFCFSSVARAASSAEPTPMSPTLFPFALPPFDSTQTATDVSWMNDVPAGARGFVSTQGEHFVDGHSRILRLWGVNLNFVGAFPSRDEAPKVASRLAKFGFNAVRLHHYEGNAAPNGLWQAGAPAGAIGSNKPKIPRQFDLDQLDKFDFFIAELIKRGIYIDLNLHVGRKTLDGEGVSYASSLPEKDKGVNLFDPQLIRLQRDFSRAILTHVNPYTKRALQDEPGVCALEMTNENSLLGMWLDGSLSMPNEYSYRLNDKWMAWLRARYKSDDALRRAWTEIDEPIRGDDLFAQPLPDGIANADAPDAQKPVALNELARMELATVSGAQGTTNIDPIGGPSVDGFVRPGLNVDMQTAGTLAWAFQVNRDGLDLQEGQPYALSFWARADTPRRISVNLWQDREPRRFGGFTGYADLTVNWEQYSFVFRPINPDPNHSRLSWNLGKDIGAVQLGEIDLRTGGKIALPDNWSLARGVPNLEWKTTSIARARRDYAEFLGTMENENVAQMRDFLRREIGVRVPIWNTQAQFAGWGGVLREGDLSDAIDVHAYWKHPNFGGAGWSGTTWKVGNESMTKAAGNDPLSAFAIYRAPGKPFVMTEWNSGQPNDFGAESLLMAASYAAWQDWAGVFLFDYHSSGSYDRNSFDGFFSIDSQPAKMVTAPAAALLFRRPPVIEYSIAPFAGAMSTVSQNRNSPSEKAPKSQVETVNIASAKMEDSGAATVSVRRATTPTTRPTTSSNGAPPNSVSPNVASNSAAPNKSTDFSADNMSAKSAVNSAATNNSMAKITLTIPVSTIPVSSAILPELRSDSRSIGGVVSSDFLGDALPAVDSVTLTLPRDLAWDEAAGFADGPTANALWRTFAGAGGQRAVPFESRIYTQLGRGLFARTTSTSVNALGKSPVFVGDTRQMVWDSAKDIFTMNTPRSKIAVGFLGARHTKVGEWQITMPQSASNWASLSLSSLDGREISASRKLLLTAVGKAENVGMVWNEDRSSVGKNWGTGPTQIEGILAYMRVFTDLKTPRVWALDESGARRFLIPSRLRNGVLYFTISPTWKTAWYEIAD